MNKILFIIGSLNRGGAERVVSILANHYAKKNWHVGICVLLDNKIGYELESVIKIFDLTSKCKGTLLSKLVSIPMWIYNLRTIYREFQPNVIVSFTTNIATISLMASIGMDVNIIVSDRNDPGAQKTYWCEKLVREKVWDRNNCKKLVFQTNYAKGQYPSRLSSKGVVINNPVLINTCERSNIYKKNNIVSVGRLEKQKNHVLLIKAFSKIANKYPYYNLYIYGEGSLRQSLDDMIKNMGLSHRVFLPGNIIDVQEKVVEAEIFVLSSIYEGCSNALLEAMMLGTACISTNIIGINEIIDNGENGIVLKDNTVDDLVVNMEVLINNNEYRRYIEENAKKLRCRYEYHVVLKKWEEVLEECDKR